MLTGPEIRGALAAVLTELTREPITLRVARRAKCDRHVPATQPAAGRAPADELALGSHAETEGIPFVAEPKSGCLLKA